MNNRWNRHNGGFLSSPEQRVLARLVTRLPRWITPDMLTALGFLGAVMTCASYALARHHLAWLWVSSAGLVLNWLGDSLDGTLARFRRIERPRYGFYVDNSLDIVAQALLALGFALSGLVRVELALLALAAFLMLSMLSLIRATTSGNFQLAYGGFGVTELRVAFILLNMFMFFLPPRAWFTIGITWTYPNLLSAAWSLIMLGTFILAFLGDLRRLAAADPPPEPIT